MRIALQEDTLGTLELDCASGYVVTQYDFGFPQPREVTYPRTLVDGSVDQTSHHGARTVSLTVLLNATLGQSPAQLRDQLAAYLHPGRRPIMLVTEHNDTRERQIRLRASQYGIPIASPKYNSMACSWIAYDGVLESQTAIEVQARPFDTAPAGREYPLVFNREYPDVLPSGSHLIENPGNTDAQWTINLYGQIVNPRLVLNDQSIRLTAGGGLTLATNQLLVIDSRTKQVLYDGNPLTSGLQYVDFLNSSWWLIPPGQSVYRLDADTWDDNASAILSFRPAWI
jgi:hypothetical protein